MLLSITLLAGCSTNKINSKNNTDVMLSSPYTAECRAEVVSNKTKNEYTYTCTRREDGTYTVDYGDMTVTVDADNVTVSKNGNEIDAAPADNDLVMIPTYFFNEYLSDGEIMPDDGGYVMRCGISGDNPYRHTAEMILDEHMVPLEMTIKDKNGNDVVAVKIEKFSRKAE